MKGIPYILALVATLVAIPATAHHSFSLTFEENKLVRLTGKVTEFGFASPHTYFNLAVTGADGKKQEWRVETRGAWDLGRHGWKPDSIKPGQMLAVEGWPARSGTNYIQLRSMSHADGSAIKLWLPPGATMNHGA